MREGCSWPPCANGQVPRTLYGFTCTGRSAGRWRGVCARGVRRDLLGAQSRFSPTALNREVELGLFYAPRTREASPQDLRPRRLQHYSTLQQSCSGSLQQSCSSRSLLLHTHALAPAPLFRALGHLRTCPRRRAHTVRLPCAAHGHARVHMCMSSRVALICHLAHPTFLFTWTAP